MCVCDGGCVCVRGVFVRICVCVCVCVCVGMCVCVFSVFFGNSHKHKMSLNQRFGQIDGSLKNQ